MTSTMSFEGELLQHLDDIEELLPLMRQAVAKPAPDELVRLSALVGLHIVWLASHCPGRTRIQSGYVADAGEALVALVSELNFEEEKGDNSHD